MSRQHKYRAWNKGDKRMIIHEQDFIPLKVTSMGVLRLNPHHEQSFWEFLPADWFELMEWTGLTDKNGKEIYYSGDLLRIIGYMGEDKEYKYDCIYKVSSNSPSGVNISFVRLFNQLPNSGLNSYPISQSLTFGDELTFDHRNDSNEKIALNDIYSDGRLVTHYTNDIEVIGNIHENPELLK